MPRQVGKAVRLPDELHARAARAAAAEGQSLAAFVAAAVDHRLHLVDPVRRADRVRSDGQKRPGPVGAARTARPAPTGSSSSPSSDECPHPLSVRVGNRCGRCQSDVR